MRTATRQEVAQAVAALEAPTRLLLALTRLEGLDLPVAAGLCGMTAARARRELATLELELERMARSSIRRRA